MIIRWKLDEYAPGCNTFRRVSHDNITLRDNISEGPGLQIIQNIITNAWYTHMFDYRPFEKDAFVRHVFRSGGLARSHSSFHTVADDSGHLEAELGGTAYITIRGRPMADIHYEVVNTTLLPLKLVKLDSVSESDFDEINSLFLESVRSGFANLYDEASQPPIVCASSLPVETEWDVL